MHIQFVCTHTHANELSPCCYSQNVSSTRVSLNFILLNPKIKAFLGRKLPENFTETWRARGERNKRRQKEREINSQLLLGIMLQYLSIECCTQVMIYACGSLMSAQREKYKTNILLTHTHNKITHRSTVPDFELPCNQCRHT